jgi:uncharacterized protein (UPF0332 family)
LTPQASAYLDKARNDLEDAAKIAAIGLARAAARSAYYAAFHAAEAFIAERSGKVARTHSGVRAKFAEMAKSEPNSTKRSARFWHRRTNTRKLAITASDRRRIADGAGNLYGTTQQGGTGSKCTVGWGTVFKGEH